MSLQPWGRLQQHKYNNRCKILRALAGLLQHAARKYFIAGFLLQSYFSCNKIKKNINFIAAFTLFYFKADVRTAAHVQ